MSLPSDFNFKSYLALNPDLDQKASCSQAVDHYLTFGIKENRKYKGIESSTIESSTIESNTIESNTIESNTIESNNSQSNTIESNTIESNNSQSNTIEKKKKKNVHILIVIVSCNKHSNLWKKIKNKTNNDLIIISGTNDRRKERRWYDKENKILWLNCNDYYDGLPEKIILMIEEVLTNPEFSHITHIIKIDDHDNEFTDKNIKNLYNYSELKEYDYLGQKLNCWHGNTACNYHFGKVPEWSYWHNKTANVSDIRYFDGGCSYILNRKSMKIINKVYNDSNIDQLRNDEIYEDVMIGRILGRNNALYKQLNYGIKGDK
jgi:hypothetical protein